MEEEKLRELMINIIEKNEQSHLSTTEEVLEEMIHNIKRSS